MYVYVCVCLCHLFILISLCGNKGWALGLNIIQDVPSTDIQCIFLNKKPNDKISVMFLRATNIGLNSTSEVETL